MATALVPLANKTLTTASSTVSFTSISGSYRDLYLVITPLAPSTAGGVTLRFNNDSGYNYNAFAIYGTGSSAGLGQVNGNALGYFGADSSGQAVIIAHIMDYSTTDRHKVWHSRANQPDGQVRGWTGRWANNAAVTSLTIINDWQNFSIGATFALYGVSA